MKLRWWRKDRLHAPPTHDEVVAELHELEHTKQKLDEYESRHNQNPPEIGPWGVGAGGGL